MKKMMMFVVGAAMAVALTGYGRSSSLSGDAAQEVARGGSSAKGVAEDFAKAVIRRETDKAVDLTLQATVGVDSKAMKELKKGIDDLGKYEIKDDKLDAETYHEEIFVPSEIEGYKVINGVKVTKDKAEVRIQFAKGKDKKAQGMEVSLQKADGKWKVTDFSYIPDGLDTK